MAYSNTSRTSSKSSSPTSNRGRATSSTNKSTRSITSNSNAMAPGSLPAPAMPATDGPQKYPTQPYLPGDSSGLMREAFIKKQFDDTINTDFTELGIANKPDPSTFDPSLATVEDFFTIYNSLFLSIPKEGIDGDDLNSHQFLIDTSTEYTQYIANREEIDELLDEINTLREQNLELVEDINTITAQLTDALAQNNG
tara:strand:- start:283 stop:873 length:591 start_codon:yes stop_codon:yes gene_type:complete